MPSSRGYGTHEYGRVSEEDVEGGSVLGSIGLSADEEEKKEGYGSCESAIGEAEEIAATQGTRTCRKAPFAWDALSPLCLCTLLPPLSTLSARGPSQTVFSATE